MTMEKKRYKYNRSLINKYKFILKEKSYLSANIARGGEKNIHTLSEEKTGSPFI